MFGRLFDGGTDVDTAREIAGTPTPHHGQVRSSSSGHQCDAVDGLQLLPRATRG